jgi:hypothetical protein
VFAIDGNRARKRVVRIARRNGQEAMLAGGPAGGLQAGERVVVYPSDALTDGARITAK